MTGVDSGVAEHDVEDAQGTLLGHLELAGTLQGLVVLAPLDFGAIISLHRTLDLHLGAEEHDTGSSNFKRNLSLLGIVLNVRGVVDLDDWLGILGWTGFHVARLFVRWLGAGTH